MLFAVRQKVKDTVTCFNDPLLFHQDGHTDSGMGLSSDNMNTLKRLESLAGRPLSIMALAYVHYTSQYTRLTHTLSQTNTLEETAKYLLGNLPAVQECRRYNCHTHTHTGFFCLKEKSATSFPFCLEKACVRGRSTKEGWEGKDLKVTD